MNEINHSDLDLHSHIVSNGIDTGVIYEAEDAVFVGPRFAEGRQSSGRGYVDFKNRRDDYIEWTVVAPAAGVYEVSWRYANKKRNRPLELLVNGTVEDPSLDFHPTGKWHDWDFATRLVELDAGENTIRLTATGRKGGNFDYMEVTPVLLAPDVFISDATATEGTDEFLVFNVSLSSPSNASIALDLMATDGTARGGAIAEFAIDLEGDPIDFANSEFEVSHDGGTTWTPADNGTEIVFAPGESDLQVRVAINDDRVDEGDIAETATLSVGRVLNGTVGDISDSGTGEIIDNDEPAVADGCAPISLLPCTDVRVEGDVTFTFDGTDSGLSDRDGEAIGFTMVDPSSNPGNPSPTGGVVGYWADKLDIDSGLLNLTTTAGLQYQNVNTQDNALGVGLNLPSETLQLQTTLVDLPAPVGGFAQAGLWLGQAEAGGAGSSEDNLIKFVVQSDRPGNYRLEALLEQNGTRISNVVADIPEDPASVALDLLADPSDRSVTATYSVAGGATQTLTTFNNLPEEWFGFDQAGIDPTIATRTFGGIFGSHRNAGASQVFAFEDFSISAVAPPPPPPPEPGQLEFERWSIPVNNATAMEYGPDGRLYVATLFGTIYAFTIDSDTRTVQEEVINTIPAAEGGNRLTLGLAIDPDSTADDVVLWVSHSSGDANNGDLNSGKISRLSGTGLDQKEDIITGLPRAIANHATNDIDFAPDGRLFAWQGGNTGAGSANTANSEFRDLPEQFFAAAALAIDIPKWKATPDEFEGNVASPIGEFVDEFYARKEAELGRPFDEVTIFATGLRNTYDGVFHSTGNIYATDNGLGVTGTVPPVPRLGDPSDRSITTLFGEEGIDDPGKQDDSLNLIVEGNYYGHPNPYRDEVIFKDGSFQGFDASNTPAGHPEYVEPFLNLGTNRSANGIIEYEADNFFGQMRGDLLLANYSRTDDISRVQLSPDGLSVVSYTPSFLDTFKEPLPLAMGPDGSVFVGEFNGDVTVLEPLGTWRTDLPNAPEAVLDAGSASVDGKLYAIGGKTATEHLSSTYVYDPGDPLVATDDIWTTGPDLPGVGVENPAVVEANGLLYVFGGSTAPFSGAVSNAAVFDPIAGNWSALPSMPTARGGASAEVLGGKIYVLGGMDDTGASLDTVEIFDPLTGTWSNGPELQTRRDNLGTAIANGQLFAFGGRTRNADGSVVNDTLNSLEIYDPIADSWTFGAAMPTGRRAFSVGEISGRIQAIGGERLPAGGAFAVHEEYNPIADSWRTLPAISTPRHGAAFATIDDAIYVAAGGPTGGSTFTNAVEAFAF